MKYLVSMNERVMRIDRNVNKLNKHVWGPSGGAVPGRTMRLQIPCGSVEQLRVLEEELMESSASYNNLVRKFDLWYSVYKWRFGVAFRFQG